MERVRSVGGTVDRKGRLNQTLAVSRGFADLLHKQLLTRVEPGAARREAQMRSQLLACPDVFDFQRNEMSLVVVASDGVWDVMSNDEVIVRNFSLF